MAELAFRISEPGKPSRELAIEVGVSIGRLDDNTCVINDPKISGRHAHVVEKDGALVIEDLGSSNHTHILGGASLKGGESHPLTIGTAFQVGSTKMVVVSTASADDGADRTIMAQRVELNAPEGGAGNQLAQLAMFKASRARLCIANEAIREIQDIDKVEFHIGRKGDAIHLAIEHKAVSTNHATIRFESKGFTIEDLGSANGTFVDGNRIDTNERRLLTPECHIRFGSVDALFVIDTDAANWSADETRYRSAVDVLVAEGTLPESQRNDAVTAAQAENRHPGEILLNRGLISVEQWTTAYKKAEFFVPSRSGSNDSGGGTGASKQLLLVLIVILIALVLILVIKPSLLGLGG